MSADRLLPSAEAEEIVALAHDLAADLAPRAAKAEAEHAFPRATFAQLGELGLLGMPYPEALGGGGLDYEVYLQVLEELASAWASVAVGVSVHVMSCYPLATFGTPEQQARWLPDMLGGALLGGYCLSEAQAGSDPAALRTTARAADGGYVLSGAKAWVTHGGEADFYTVFARTADHRSRGITCFLVPADAPGLTAAKPESKMGLTGSTTATIDLDDVFVEEARRIGDEGQGLQIALSALDSGRLGIAAAAVGLGQAALDHAVDYATERETFGKAIIEHQGLGFLLADMAATVESSRATLLDAARRRDRGLPFGRQASIAKLVATDGAMKVTTDAVQVLGGYGYTTDFPVERYMREAKIMQIFEGTNQIQRMVIARHLAGQGSGAACAVTASRGAETPAVPSGSAAGHIASPPVGGPVCARDAEGPDASVAAHAARAHAA
jgi:alkylation response protein AidB-like acyl-CoA dehydrogenase